MGLFSCRRARPAAVPTDHIIPIRYWDDLDYFRHLSHTFTLRLDDVLDVDRLEKSLERLTQIKGWDQLGARLRLNDNGRMEYHFPAEYTKARPAYNFTTTKFDVCISEHSIGAQLPRSNHDPSVLIPSSATFAPIACHPTSPKKMDDWICTDRPQLQIHVSLFQDATLITLPYLHTLSDAISRGTFFEAWTAVLRGREDEVPPFVPFEHDPLGTLGTGVPVQSYKNFGRVLRGLSFVVFGLRCLWEMVWFKQEEHSIHLPGRCVDRLKETARQELEAMASGDEPKVPFVSESDVVMAWWVRTVVTALNPSADRTVVVMNVFNVYALFEKSFPAGGAGFIGNAFFYACTLLVAGQVIRDVTLGYVAPKIRHALMEHRTREQVQAMAAMQRASFTKTPPVVGKVNSLFLACTNQHKARYFDLDFSPAVVSPGVPLSERTNALGRPSYINDIEHSQGYPSHNVVRILGKDTAGDYWLLFKTRQGAWPAIHRQLMALINES